MAERLPGAKIFICMFIQPPFIELLEEEFYCSADRKIESQSGRSNRFIWYKPFSGFLFFLNSGFLRDSHGFLTSI
jgi:hypothetical protein